MLFLPLHLRRDFQAQAVQADAVLGGEGAINRFRRRGDANEMDEVGGHGFFKHR